jgi:amidase
MRVRPAIPITSKQDTIGPIVRSVADAAIVLSVIAGHDALDNDTTAIPHPIPDYSKALNLSALYGKRIGVPRKILLDPKFTNITQFELDTFKVALKTLESLGATIIEDANLPSIEDIYQTRVNRSTFENVLIVDYRVNPLSQPDRGCASLMRL